MQTACEVITPGLEVHPRTRFALEYMREHCGKHLALEEVAEYVHLSPSRLRHLLRAETGASFRADLMELRLLFAEADLADWSLGVSEIAYRRGYASVPSFSREFKRRFGMSPSSYRRARFSRPGKTPLQAAA